MSKYIICLCLFFSTLILANDFEDFEQEYQKKEVKDSFYTYNKAMSKFNYDLYTYILRPIAISYKSITPSFVRTGVKNVFDTTRSPAKIINHLLTFEFKKAGEEFGRFCMNVIFGFGLLDSASKTSLKSYEVDFGTTLGKWGVNSGTHLVLPILGPSNVRDALALPIDWFLVPEAYIDNFWLGVGVNAALKLNELSFEYEKIDDIYQNSVDYYIFIRDAYEQRRQELIKQGN
ncbi:VacJ family lipoprotein [Campylobacter armoricus]|uniref:Lipid asymmetry ABC transporter MlaABCDEF, lipoprotein MlaA n=1 Tax=Campylobacter armoricus TaxID=2505970 RepID=A0A7L5I2A5_9BACT|nr:VacJ family lipoprotein [Campylobacter armoricus]QKF80211.1 lipid asymmetry ABC transporter MlaABCDEF, lipoprotein MlaA [Campylobacter armoricus]